MTLTVTRGLESAARAVLVAAALGIGATPAWADPPTPLSPEQFAFPGSTVGPASAVSTGVALADRWLGDEPFENPAAPHGLRIILSPALVRVSRQDLRADNREYSETAAFLDGAGVAIGLPVPRRLTLAAYAYQPVLRIEDNAYVRGRLAPDPGTTPAVIASHSSAREVRAGAALAAALGACRAGVGVEWTHREDRYQVSEQSADPVTAGSDSLGFKGSAVGMQAGVRWDHGDSTAGSFAVGAALRYLPALEVKGEHTVVRAAGSTADSFSAERSSGWEMGVSARVVVSPVFSAFVGVGGRTAQHWEGLDLAAGRAWEWKLGGEFHDERAAWALRFGLGQERQSDVPEPRANVVAVGFGWRFSDFAADVGGERRTLVRTGEPRSAEDRVVVSLRVPR
ncbi:MAG: hypothetical protein E6K81_03750 [Candidatus Eisenbacteria bacterium]|uniref:Uncharacterized protein n=1 Tax=Eiseniibacteriota bacterium TaxID=2212470 RepID=A0A538UCJ7_UNCEI|nr:MAG: hypothetical protein E6K81_03750 [Candidatus Eisenbacteria bacterium]